LGFWLNHEKMETINGALGWVFHHQGNKALTFWVHVFGGPWDVTYMLIGKNGEQK